MATELQEKIHRSLVEITASVIGTDATELATIIEKNPNIALRGADSLGLDSLDLAELIMEIESKVGLTISDDDVASLQTFAQVEQYVLGKAANTPE